MPQHTTLQLVEVREGGEVRAAAVLEKSDGKLRVLLADGRELRLPVTRVLDRGGEVQVADAQDSASVSGAVAAWEAAAEKQGEDVDLAELHELLAEERGGGAVVELADVAPLVLGDALPSSRAAVHRALARKNPWFRFDGKRWLVRPAEEVEKEQARLREQQRRAEERAGFVARARSALSGEIVEWPESARPFLRQLEEVAVEGEAARCRKEAGLLVSEIRGGAPGHLSPELAFELLVGLGLFDEHENLELRRAGVRREFPAEVLEQAESLARKEIRLEPGREDLRKLEVVTIDDAATTEIDDGLSFVSKPQGFQLGIHIADASYFVERDSLVDEEALDRSTTYYLPGFSIPMLPAAISEGAASLNEGEDRPALSFLIELTPHGEILSSRVTASLIRVERRMSYEDCEAVLAEEAPPEDEERWAWLRRIAKLAEQLESDRIAAGSTPIRAPEVRIKVSDEGSPEVQVVDPGRPARKLVSEMMILANRLAAQACRDRCAAAIFRKQEPPNGSVAPPPTDRYDPVTVNAFRRTLQRTQISLDPGPHAGLGVDAYLQATSPIRRYQDLVVHRIIKAFLSGAPRPYSREELQSIAEITEAAGRQARQVENATDEYWILRSYEGRVGDVLDAIVLRTDHRRTHVEICNSSHRASIPAREGHDAGQLVRLMIRSAHARRKTLSLEEVRGA